MHDRVNRAETFFFFQQYRSGYFSILSFLYLFELAWNSNMTAIGHQCSTRASGVTSTRSFWLVLGFFLHHFELCCSWCKMWRTHIHNRLVCGFIFVFHMNKIWSAYVLVFHLIFLTITFFSSHFPLLLLGTNADDGPF